MAIAALIAGAAVASAYFTVDLVRHVRPEEFVS